MQYIDKEYLRKWIPERKPDAHKGDFGKILFFAGSTGMAGAAALSGRAALRSGAGLVRFLLPSLSDPIYPILQVLVPEATCITPEQIPDYNEYDAIAVGSGPGEGQERIGILEQILKNYEGKLLLDADALNSIAKETISRDTFESSKAELVITPHVGEAKRLLGGNEQIRTPEERLNAVRELSNRFCAVTVLKGNGTLICTPEGEVLENTTGNPGMATAGSGDVLSGIITALSGQGIPSFPAAACGVFLHGKAGDIAADKLGQISLNAGDLVNSLPDAFMEVV